MQKLATARLIALLCLLLVWNGSAAEALKPDSEGYIRDWVMLAPIAVPEGSEAIFQEQIKDEAALRPKAGDCCVFCSYGLVPCPPIPASEGCYAEG